MQNILDNTGYVDLSTVLKKSQITETNSGKISSEPTLIDATNVVRHITLVHFNLNSTTDDTYP